ncbi:hypothetical protein [Gellertiella hungarica]|uniref:Uncharacterized protein n=1 Tax=Gellertiella hungarica TaxID=1572859 RepID=A0A7W6J1Q6_9HYPH|nr:hypothetical protein [Gellertiella hungarica]MBB4063191.1 hypothetical protein [Gellertiella hungarica]
MADFVAVIRRAVDGLSDNTPEMRAKVYDKARGAVLRQLESMKPRPPEEMLRRQLEKLETAIREVEAEHAEALPPLEEPENAEAELVPAPIAADEAPPAQDVHAADEEVAPAAAVDDRTPEESAHPQPVSAEETPEQADSVSAAPAPVEEAGYPAPRQELSEPAPQPAAEPVVPAAPAPAVRVIQPAAPASPYLWGDESWAGEEEPQPADPVAHAPSYSLPEVEPASEPAPVSEAAPAVEPPPVFAPEPAVEPVTEAPAEALPVEAPRWDEVPAETAFAEVPEPQPAVEPAVPVEPEPVRETYPDFPVEDPVEKYASMAPVSVQETVTETPAGTAWPEGGVEAEAQARIGEEEWVAPAHYEPAAEADRTPLEDSGFAPAAETPVVDPLAWSPESHPLAAEPAAAVEPVEEPRGELAAPQQGYFDAPVLTARVTEAEPAYEPAGEPAPAASPEPATAAKAPTFEDDWDLVNAELGPVAPVAAAAAAQPAAATGPARADARRDWDDSPFDDVPLPETDDLEASRARSRQGDEGWDQFDDFEAYDTPTGNRAEPLEDEDDLLYAPVEKPARSYRIEPKRRMDFTSIGLGLLGLLLVAGSGYGAWVFRDTLSGLVTGLVSSPPAENKAQTPAKTGTPAKTDDAKPAADAQPANGKAPSQETASAEPELQKFTQRLRPDGSEVDEGKADGAASGEGKSVAAQTVASANPEEATAPAGTTPPAANNTPAATIPVGVSQKMFLYEERVGQTSPVAIEGAVVWSLKKEPADNGRTESVVQAQVSAPERGLSALITFKRNLDPSLPASHLIELVFSIPKEFEGGAIESVQRVALKQTEQDRGDPLIAVPAKITDDFHMIALNDYADARKFNLNLLETRDWIDIPVTYRNGRRALITMEKGATGSEAFKQAISDWRAEDGPAAVVSPPAGQQPASTGGAQPQQP